MKLKKWIMGVLCAAMVLGISSCGGEKPVKTEFDTAALEKESLQCVDDMRSGDFDAVVARLNDSTQKQLDAASLKKAWDGTVASLGAFVEHVETKSEASGDNMGTTVLSRFENNGLLTTITYDSDSHICGLWLSYQALESAGVSNDVLEEISIQVGMGESKVDGLLTLPKNVEKPPVVILVQGSGQSDMDETIGAAGNKPFRDIAHGLAEQGIASIRYHKRYFQYPNDAAQLGANLTVEDEVLNDVNAAITLAAGDERVNGERIYVLGHSLGGMLAPKIAMDNQQLSGIISMAGTLRGLEDVILDQNKDALALMTNLTDEQKRDSLEQVEAEVQKVKELKQGDPSVTIFNISSVYWFSLKQATGTQSVGDVNCPMLILQGGSDFQVYPDVDYKLWQDTLRDRENVTFHLYDGLNHLFMKANGKTDVTEYDPAGTVEPEVISDIGQWVISLS